MRRYIKKNILSLLNSINEAHNILLKEIGNKNYGMILQLLTDCQAGAIQIGNTIEKSEGEGTITVELLEEYCEMVYLASQEMNGETNKKKIINKLNIQLFKVINSIKYDIREELEVVFFPYKASMWDSLESVWLAAKEDPDCNTYVIPIPYYDRLPDGSFGKMHYEGNLYPNYVPVIDYRKYDIKSRQPDVIFIHNPYDGGNLVTSVHPDYYSDKLKNYTDLLAYIPYFVVSGNVPEHFCSCTGVIYADKVFVQSEIVRNKYVEIFKDIEKKNNCFGMFGEAEYKFIATGSPKFDKVINSKPEDFILPDKWRSLIELPDGNRKKVVLYNTSIGAILKGNKEYIDKIKYVLECFRNRDDVILWWRPHPLNEATYESMRPQLLKDYTQIISDYKSEGWGIYDDTADLHRSISISSMYYGDWSSLVSMYQFTGKPILIQDTAFCGKNKIAEVDIDEEELHKLQAQYFYKSYNNSVAKHANFYNYKEMSDLNFGIKEFLDFFIKSDSYEKISTLLLKQVELRKQEICNSNGTAGSNIYKICKESIFKAN